MRAACTGTCGSSATGSSPRGPFPKVSPRPRARTTSPCTRRTTPSSTRSFYGEIPQGEYGGGQMTIWDTGHYDVEKWSDSEVKFVLHGAKVDGEFRALPDQGSQLDDPPARSVHPGGRTAHHHQADAGCRRQAPDGRRELGLRDQMGRYPGDPVRRGRTGASPEPQRSRRDRAPSPSWRTSGSSSG